MYKVINVINNKIYAMKIPSDAAVHDEDLNEIKIIRRLKAIEETKNSTLTKFLLLPEAIFFNSK